MAKMFPVKLPAYVLDDPYRAAEIEIYNRLRDEVSDDYVCYYSRPWLGLDQHGFERDGEADFVVAHPDLGLLVLEVKGGRVSRDEGTEKWTSKNRLGITNKINDPVLQAVGSKHQLLRKLKEQPAWGGRFITLRHGVILPDNARPAKDLGPNMPLRIFLFGGELNRLQDWMDARLRQGNGEDDAPGMGLDSGGMQVLHELVAGRIELRPSLARALRDDRKTIDVLSAEQIDVLDGLQDHKRVAVAGGAGTGKTMLALEKAARLGEAGQNTLLVCFNAPLAEHLLQLSKGMNGVSTCTFHSLCDYMATSAGIALSARGSPAYFAELPGALSASILERPDMKFDAIVVDEGQDFSDEWFNSLEQCLTDPANACFYVFFDDNQKLYDRQSVFLGRMATPFYLTRNFRNTQAIHASTLPWYKGRLSRAVGPVGVDVEWIEAERPQDTIALLDALLGQLVRDHGLRPEDIAILTAGSTQNHAAVRGGTIADLPVANTSGNPRGYLVFDTVRRFKGLERPAIILLDPGKLNDPELAYVGLSRPSVFLAVIGGKRNLDRLKEGK